MVKAAYPKMWWLKTGYVIVKAKGMKKEELLKKLAEAMKRR